MLIFNIPLRVSPPMSFEGLESCSALPLAPACPKTSPTEYLVLRGGRRCSALDEAKQPRVARAERQNHDSPTRALISCACGVTRVMSFFV